MTELESDLLEKLKSIKLAIITLKDENNRLHEEIEKLRPTEQPSASSTLAAELIASRTVRVAAPATANAGTAKNYVFARATEETAQKFQKFIKKCIHATEAGKAFIVQPETAAIYADISVKTKDTFMGILMGMSLNGKKLVVKADDRYFANFSADDIIEYLLKEV